jgi:hypothetical protein
MSNLELRLERLLNDAEECDVISRLADDAKKRDFLIG